MPNTHTHTTISHRAALNVLTAAISKAEEMGWSVACVVVDPSGQTIASVKMDATPAQVMEFACDKAYTAALGKSTRAFCDHVSKSPSLQMGLSNRPRLCAWDGGIPIYLGAQLVGALGVSGAASVEDIQCAEFAIQSAGFNLPASD